MNELKKERYWEIDFPMDSFANLGVNYFFEIEVYDEDDVLVDTVDSYSGYSGWSYAINTTEDTIEQFSQMSDEGMPYGYSGKTIKYQSINSHYLTRCNIYSFVIKTKYYSGITPVYSPVSVVQEKIIFT